MTYSGASWPQELFNTEGEFKEWKDGLRCDINMQMQRLFKELLSEIRTLVQQAMAARHSSPPPPRHYARPTRQGVRPQRDRWDDEGRPICRKCKQPGHIVRFCRVTALQPARDVADRTWAQQERFSGGCDERQADSDERARMSEERNQVLTGMAADLRDQVYVLKEERSERESVVRQLQQELADSKKKLSISEAALGVSIGCRNDLEGEKSRLIHDVERLKNKLQESEDRSNQAERRINALESSVDDKDREMSTRTQRLQEAVKKLEMENRKLEATAKQQSDKIEVMQREALEAVGQPERLPGGRGAGEMEEEKGELTGEKEPKTMVMKTAEQEKVMDGMLEKVDLFLQKQAAFQEPLDQLNMTTGSSMYSAQEQRIRGLVGFLRLWGKLGRREVEMAPSRYDTV